jgi:hypothetical protein
MTEPDSHTHDRSGEPLLSTADYLRLAVLNRVSGIGLTVAAVGAVLVGLTSPVGPLSGVDPTIAAGTMLGGVFVFALGFSLGQRSLSERDDW